MAKEITAKIKLQVPAGKANPAPPVDTAGRSDTQLPSVGAHQTHVTEGTLSRAFTCGDCHPVPDPTNIYDHINGLGRRLFSGLQDLADDRRIPAWVEYVGSIGNVYFTTKDEIRDFRDTLMVNTRRWWNWRSKTRWL